MVLRKIVKPQFMVLRIFLKFLKITNNGFLYFKKIYINAYVDTKDYFDKYFEIDTILTIFFFYQSSISDLNSNRRVTERLEGN